MKRNLIVLIALFSIFATFGACTSGSSEKNQERVAVDSSKKARFEFEKEEHDFGTITEGEIVSYTFKFRNIGEADLIINSARASCGCTVPKYTKEPIPPQGEGQVEVTFDSSNRTGKQYKTVTLTANTEQQVKRLSFTAVIKDQ